MPFRPDKATSPTPCTKANPVRGIGIADTKIESLLSPGSWAAPLYLWSRPEAGDGQNLYADPGGTALFVVGASGGEEWSRVKGAEIAGNSGGWREGAAVFVAPNCRALPNLTLDASLVQVNQGFAKSPNCAFRKFGGAYVSPHDKALGGKPDGSSYNFFDATVDDPVGGDASSHITVDANPCTHDAIVGYIAADGKVRVKLVSPLGAIAGGIEVDNGVATQVDLEALLKLDRYVGRVSLATATDRSVTPPHCYLYAAYDYTSVTAKGTPQERHSVQARMSVWDITNEKIGSWMPVHVYQATVMDPGIQAQCDIWAKKIADLKTQADELASEMNSRGPDGQFPSPAEKAVIGQELSKLQNEITVDQTKQADCLLGRFTWHSTVTASAFAPNVGWFFYDDQGKRGKGTVFRGYVDGNMARKTMHDLGAISKSTIVGDPGGGDFIAPLTGGDGGGYLLPTWAEDGAILGRWIKP